MAELEVTVRYKSKPAKLALSLVVLLMPVWGILVPGLIVWILLRFAASPALYLNYLLHNLFQFIGIILGLFLITALGVKAVLNLSDNRIVLSKIGMELPFFLGNTFGLRRTFSWSTIRNAQLVESGSKRELVLHTTDGFPIYLDLACISSSELEQLLLALDVWAINCEKNPLLETLQQELSTSCIGQDSTGYTQMWEEELSRRFSSTAYVPLEPGCTLQDGRLKVLNQLSFGGLTAVYLCQKNDRELVVLKEAVIPQETEEETERKALELFEREAQILMALEHRAITRVLDYFVESGRHYLLIQYHNGQDLHQYVKQNGPQPPETVFRWALEILDILNFLHGQDPPIIHRDVTPDNIVLNDQGSLVMIDFGAANEFLGNATGTLVGKQSFIAPEQFRGKATTQSDLYSLGSTLHFLLTGNEPVPLSASHPKTSNPGLSEEIDHIVAGMTEMDLDKRIKSAEEARKAIYSIFNNMSVEKELVKS